ncbi:glycosyltransferase [Geomonas azotofigens]|uniref:glycosyltransferase n=1 Tax=Geomonas azotofigens TaxID=2843196 RepID=UPI001C11796A|nr:glycosyltransferase [Geomonas azotofigens]MBU5614579.1 glycosyltransferase [Geomonas azotofigens]
MNVLQRLASFFLPRKPLKVGWLLLGDANTGSSRIHGLNIHNYLIKQGVESLILQSSPRMINALTLSEAEQQSILGAGFDVLLFQKVRDAKAQAFAKEARRRRIRTVFIQCDCIETDMVSAVDDLVVISANLRDYYREKYGINATVIEDAIEVPTDRVKVHTQKAPLELVWVGYSDNWESLGMVRDALALPGGEGFTLKTISNHPEADVPWALETVTDEILASDIAVIPAHLHAWGMGKSSNRLTMFMALGMPVVASPVPSYLDVVRQGENAFIARSAEEWLHFLSRLRDDRLRSEMGRQAREDATKRFSLGTIGPVWINFLKSGRKAVR